jgi:hypothetical protein
LILHRPIGETHYERRRRGGQVHSVGGTPSLVSDPPTAPHRGSQQAGDDDQRHRTRAHVAASLASVRRIRQQR